MRFDEVITRPFGTIIRRTSWPLHWWLTIIEKPDTFGSRDPKVAISFKALVDMKQTPVQRQMPAGQTVITQGITVDAAIADDWVALDKPSIDVLTPKPDSPAPDYALSVSGQLIPLASMPYYRTDEYRTVTVLTPLDGTEVADRCR